MKGKSNGKTLKVIPRFQFHKEIRNLNSEPIQSSETPGATATKCPIKFYGRHSEHKKTETW